MQVTDGVVAGILSIVVQFTAALHPLPAVCQLEPNCHLELHHWIESLWAWRLVWVWGGHTHPLLPSPPGSLGSFQAWACGM